LRTLKFPAAKHAATVEILRRSRDSPSLTAAAPVRYKPSSAFYHTDIADWGGHLLAKEAGAAFVSLTAPLTAQNVENRRWVLIANDWGFHFNDRRTPRDLTLVRSILTRSFRIVHEIQCYQWERNAVTSRTWWTSTI